eukprot:2032076-Rhodomonas_salina.2
MTATPHGPRTEARANEATTRNEEEEEGGNEAQQSEDEEGGVSKVEFRVLLSLLQLVSALSSLFESGVLGDASILDASSASARINATDASSDSISALHLSQAHDVSSDDTDAKIVGKFSVASDGNGSARGQEVSIHEFCAAARRCGGPPKVHGVRTLAVCPRVYLL